MLHTSEEIWVLKMHFHGYHRKTHAWLSKAYTCCILQNIGTDWYLKQYREVLKKRDILKSQSYATVIDQILVNETMTSL